MPNIVGAVQLKLIRDKENFIQFHFQRGS